VDRFFKTTKAITNELLQFVSVARITKLFRFEEFFIE